MSNYAVNSPFERDSSSAGLTRLRRDAIAYIDVKLSGAGDASAGQDPAAGMSAAWAAARAANGTEDEDELSDSDLLDAAELAEPETPDGVARVTLRVLRWQTLWIAGVWLALGAAVLPCCHCVVLRVVQAC